MIVSISAILLQSAAPVGACVAWRDPDNGKVIGARELQDRKDAMRRRMLNTDASDQSVIENARAPLPCVRRAGDPEPTK